MKKIVRRPLFMILFASVIDGAAHNPFIVKKTPGYGDVLIQVSHVESWDDKKRFFKEIEQQKSSFFVELPWSNAELAERLIKKYGLSFYYGDNKKMQLFKTIKDNPIPPIITGNSSVKAFLSRVVNGKMQILFTEEEGRLSASLPGGVLEHQEDICSGILRELSEELSLRIPKNQLLFLGVLNRVKAFAYGITHNEFLFHIHYDGKQVINPDGKEVKGFSWEDIDEILEKKKAAGLPVFVHYLTVLKSIKDGKHGKSIITLPDHRQLNPRARRDPHDIMVFCPVE